MKTTNWFHKSVLAGLLLCGGAPVVALAGDSMPFLTEAYFPGPCPAGWKSLDGAKGRFLLPSPLGGGVGGFAGVALDGTKAPAHLHEKIAGKINLPSKNFILIGGCCNGNLGDSGDYSISGATSEHSGGLPYIQYSACMKRDDPDGSAIPSGLLIFMAQPTCPDTWQQEAAVSGRYIVALPDNGTPYYSFGGKPLAPSEVRTHVHGVKGKISFGGHDIAGGSGCCAGGYAASGSFDLNDAKTQPVAADEEDSAVQAPYYTALMCRKN
jgi:hypothetical protein